MEMFQLIFKILYGTICGINEPLFFKSVKNIWLI